MILDTSSIKIHFYLLIFQKSLSYFMKINKEKESIFKENIKGKDTFI